MTAGTAYVASYFAPNGHYAEDDGFFTSAYDSAPLHAPASLPGAGNGLYSYGADAFPSSTFAAANYWVDPMFVGPGSGRGSVAQLQAGLNPPRPGLVRSALDVARQPGPTTASTRLRDGSPPPGQGRGRGAGSQDADGGHGEVRRWLAVAGPGSRRPRR